MNLTPGPWSYSDGQVQSAQGKTIAYLSRGASGFRNAISEADANGLAIAALPALIDALEATVLAHSQFRAKLPTSWDGDPLSRTIEAGRAALAKAMGS